MADLNAHGEGSTAGGTCQLTFKRLVIFDDRNIFIAAEQFAESTTGRIILEVDVPCSRRYRQRFFYISDGACSVLSKQKLFCVSCCVAKRNDEGFYWARTRDRAVVKFCRNCGTELCYVFELKDGIYELIERNEKIIRRAA